MIPSYEELVSLNPRLRNRSKNELEKLIQTITSKGYIWKEKQKFFYHEKMEMHIRTAGLDLFTPEKFLQTYKVWSNKEVSSGFRLGQRYIPMLFIAFIIDISLGWLILPLILWGSSLVVLLLTLIIIQKIAHNRVHVGEKTVE